MDTSITYLGEFRFTNNSRKHREPYWASQVHFGDINKTVVDAAGIDDHGTNIVRLLPYSDGNTTLIDSILQDGDLLAYVQGPKRIELTNTPTIQNNLDYIGDVLKGRATHAELGYLNDTHQAMQVSLWARPGPMTPEDRRFFNHTDNDTISIYRASFAGYGIDMTTERLLKSEIKRWKEIVQPVYFPCGEEMNVDPADFTSVSELQNIAKLLLAHSPSNPMPPFKFKLNCVQWSTLVFSLAVCFPLSRQMLSSCELLNDYELNWSDRLGFATDGLMGLTELPIPFYSIDEIIENTLDLYVPEAKPMLAPLLQNLPLQQILSSRGIADSKRIMPNAFVIENRLRGLGIPRKTKTVFEYIATAAPAFELDH